MKILFLSDSRGYGLEAYIKANKLFKECSCTVVTKKGATIERLATEIDREEKSFDLFVLVAGICNLTTKDQNTGLLTYESDETKLQSIIQILRELRQKLGEKLIQATIIPACIDKYNNRIQNLRNIEISNTSNGTKRDQTNLEQDIKRINLEIIEGNIEHELEAIKLHKCVQRRQLKRVGRSGTKTKRHIKTHYTGLYDGVHPDQNLKQQLFKYICKVTNNRLVELAGDRPPLRIDVDISSDSINSDFSEPNTSPEKDTGNFKRYKPAEEQV